jgi:kinesin family protein C2/C3
VDYIEDGSITISTPSKHGKGQRPFSFNKVFGPSASQGWFSYRYFSDTQILTLHLHFYLQMYCSGGLL